MTKQAKELYNLLKGISRKDDEVFAAIVKSVNKNECTCTIEVDDLEMGDVRLRATVKDGEKGIKIYPKVGSVVLVQKIGEKEEFFITLFSEVEEIVYQIDACEFGMNTQGFNVKNGINDLKDIIKKIIDATKQIVVMQGTSPDYAKLNDANNQLNNLMQ